MKNLRRLIPFVVVVMAVPVLRGQDLGTLLHQYTGAHAAAYAGSLLSAWGAGLNSGFVHSARVHQPLGFDLQVKASLVSVAASDRTFRFAMPAEINVGGEVLLAGRDYPADVDVATALGEKTGTVVSDSAGREVLRLPGGLGLTVVPLVMPQLAVGLPFGVEVMVRFLPTTRLGSVGKVNLFGFGLRYDLGQHLPSLPVDIGLSFVSQNLGVQDAVNAELMRASATACGITVSREVLMLTVYGTLQLESSSWEVSGYTARVPTGPAQYTPVPVPPFTFEGRNAARVLVGARLLLAVLTVHADYSAGEVPALTFGVGLSFP